MYFVVRMSYCINVKKVANFKQVQVDTSKFQAKLRTNFISYLEENHLQEVS